MDKDEGRKREKENIRSQASQGIDVSADRFDTVPQELPANLDSFTMLVNYTSARCISIFMPTHKAGVEVNEQQDMINFKTKLQYVNSKLKEQGAENPLFIGILPQQVAGFYS